MRLPSALLLAVLLGACASRAPPLHQVVDVAPPELAAAPFFPQTALHCGPAALATVLGASGVAGVTPEELAPQLFVPGRGGTFQAELLAQTRAYRRVPVKLEGRMQAIADALAEGYPVLVLQNLHTPASPQWHYAVVVGMDLPRNQVILRSGEKRRQVESATHFMRSWSLAGRWAVVAASAQQIPAFASPQQWLAATAPAESSAGPELARSAYIAAANRWPEEVLAWAALGNAQYLLEDTPAARRSWQQALLLDASFAPARNNLDVTGGK